MNNQLLDGQSFNAKYQEKIFIKLTHKKELNIDKPEGILFCFPI